MEIGICVGLEQMSEIDALGFDYVEVNAAVIAALREEEFNKLVRDFNHFQTPVKTSNCFFPGSIRLVGSDKEMQSTSAYIEHVMSRMKALGVELMVLGSGGSRRFTEDYGYPAALRDLLELAKVIGDLAKIYDLTVVIEPLNRLETNLLNSVAEAAAFVAAINHPRIGLLADLYHMKKDGEALAELLRLAPVHHVHIATLERTIPVERDDFEPLLRVLFQTNYDGRISIEASSESFRHDAGRALAQFRELATELYTEQIASGLP